MPPSAASVGKSQGAEIGAVRTLTASVWAQDSLYSALTVASSLLLEVDTVSAQFNSSRKTRHES